MRNHYDWLFQNLMDFFRAIDLPGVKGNWVNTGIISAHGDKCYGYRSTWAKAGIPFEHGVAIYLLTYCSPYSSEVRETKNGWKAVEQWVIESYPKFSQYLPPLEVEGV